MTPRPDRDFTLMDTAFLWAQRSTCSRLNVGCVLSREGRILVQGYNGAPAGLSHCSHQVWDGSSPIPGWVMELVKDPRVNEMYEGGLGENLVDVNPRHPFWQNGTTSLGFGTPPGCTRSVHAEQNAIAFAARWGVELKDAHASVTHQPCLSCAQTLINAGIKSLDYVEPYRLKEGVDLLAEAGIEVNRLVDWSTASVIGSSL